MSAKVHRLTPAGPQIDRPGDVMALAKSLLRQAARGEIKGFGVFIVDGANGIITDWAPGCAASQQMVCGAARLNYRILKIDSDG